jgi:Putative addiction module component
VDAVEFISDGETDIPIPQWQIDEVKRRIEYYDKHQNELVPWEEARKRLKT